MDAIRAVRALTTAMIVCKRGPMGCVVFPSAIPADIEDGIKGPGFPVEVYNVLGAGDAFMSGFLRGYVRGEPAGTCCAYANAGGAFAVCGCCCSSEYPTWVELQHFLTNGASERALRKDAALTHIHHATTRRAVPKQLRIFSIDPARMISTTLRASWAPIRRGCRMFKTLAVQAAAQVAGRQIRLRHVSRSESAARRRSARMISRCGSRGSFRTIALTRSQPIRLSGQWCRLCR